MTCPVHSAKEIEPAIQAVANQSSCAVIVVSSAFAAAHRRTIIAQAAQLRLPAGSVITPQLVGSGVRLFMSIRVGDLPVQAPNKFQLVINLAIAPTLHWLNRLQPICH